MRLERLRKEVDELNGQRRLRWKQRRKYIIHMGERELNHLNEKETMSGRVGGKKEKEHKNR
jgi:hypothetical protein